MVVATLSTAWETLWGHKRVPQAPFLCASEDIHHSFSHSSVHSHPTVWCFDRVPGLTHGAEAPVATGDGLSPQGLAV